jgi:hypothetical protein
MRLNYIYSSTNFELPIKDIEKMFFELSKKYVWSKIKINKMSFCGVVVLEFKKEADYYILYTVVRPKETPNVLEIVDLGNNYIYQYKIYVNEDCQLYMDFEEQ